MEKERKIVKVMVLLEEVCMDQTENDSSDHIEIEFGAKPILMLGSVLLGGGA